METSRPPIRVAILDHDGPNRCLLAQVIHDDVGLRITGLHEDREKALADLALVKPEVALLEATILDGAAAVFIATARSRAPRLRVVLMLPCLDPSAMLLQFDAKADGYLVRTESHQEVVRAVNEIVKGGSYMCPQIQKAAMSYFEVLQAVLVGTDLTPRESQIAARLVSYHEKEIARALGISTETVHAHIKSIYRKLEVHNRRDFLCRWALLSSSSQGS